MIRFNICISLLLFCFTQGFAATDVYVSAGTAKARYSESTDGQNADLAGTEQSLSIRNINSLGKIDLGLDAGTLKLSGDSQGIKLTLKAITSISSLESASVSIPVGLSSIWMLGIGLDWANWQFSDLNTSTHSTLR